MCASEKKQWAYFSFNKISLARDSEEPPAHVIKPQSNCKNSRWGGSNTTESPIQPTNLIIAYTIPSAVHCLSLEALAKSIQEHEKQNSLFAKALEFPGLVVFIQTIHKRLQASIAFVVSICSESNEKRNLKPLPAETEEGIPVPGPMGRRGRASAVDAMLSLQLGWPQPGPLQLLPLLIGLEKGKRSAP